MTKETRSTKYVVPTVSRSLPDGSLLELVYDAGTKRTGLAHCTEGRCSTLESVDTEAGERLVPISAKNNLIRHRAVLLPATAEAFGSLTTLLAKVDAYLHRYVDLSDDFRRLAGCYVLLSWVHDAFNELPYLRLRGDYGSGKTRALTVIGSICYRPFFASGASTVSPIFHTLDTFGGTLVLDEADFRFSDEKSELVKILNNGNVRGFAVLRTAITQQKEFDPRAFNVFGPKVVAMRRSFDDPALESRFLTEDMGGRALRSDIPINLPKSQEEEALALRNELLMYRFLHLGKTKIDDTLVDRALSPRLNQIAVPLLSVVGDATLRQGIVDAVKRLERTLVADSSSTTEAAVLEVLVDALEQNERTSVPLAEITKAFVERFAADYERPITNRYIGSILRTRLRVATYKSHGVYVIPTSERAKVEHLASRFGVTRSQSGADPARG